MADKNNKNQSAADNQNNKRQDAIPGDILTQLNAEQATLGKTYTAIQATKNAIEDGNKLQEIANDFLLDIGRHAEAISMVMSSVDSKVERLVNKFLSANPVGDGNQKQNSDITPEYALDVTVQGLTALVSDILNKLNDTSEEPTEELPYAQETTVQAISTTLAEISSKLDKEPEKPEIEPTPDNDELKPYAQESTVQAISATLIDISSKLDKEPEVPEVEPNPSTQEPLPYAQEATVQAISATLIALSAKLDKEPEIPETQPTEENPEIQPYAQEATVQAISATLTEISAKMSVPPPEPPEPGEGTPPPEPEDNSNLGYATEVTVVAMSTTISEIAQKLDALTQTIASRGPAPQLGPQPNPPLPPGPTNQQNAQTEATIRRALERFQNQSTGRDRNFYQETAQNLLSQISDRIAQLSNDFRNGTIDQAEFESQMHILGDQAAQIHDTLQDVTSHNEQVIADATNAFNNAQQRNTQSLIDQLISERSGDLSSQFDELTSQFRNGQMSEQDFTDAVGPLISEMGNLQLGAKALTGLADALKNGFDANTGENHTTKQAVSMAGDIVGDLAGAKIGAALGASIGGPVGAIVGDVIGNVIGERIGAVFDALGDHLDYLANKGKKSRDEILRAGFDKIEKDVKAMATYSIEIYETASQNIYSAWDKNLASINATQGYTKEALNTLQDAVAQRLIKEGYGNTIDASQYLDQLSSTLNAHLGGELAEAFAAQNLILQKAVPEVDLSSMAAQFAAIYTNANAEGMSGEDEMIAAMNQVAGAAKALEQTTGGNNQFLTQTGEILSKATEIINRADGNASQIADLATQMMAAEAPLTALAPQLSGFTTELVDILTNNNDATAVALRAIMNDIDSNIGVSSTAFMQSFMEDTQGTLSTAFEAIQEFIDKNENEASRQEFLQAMESIFGVSGSKLAQIDFGNVAKQIGDANIATNMDALTRAENLVRGGETTSYEEQLVANTANQLLATNAISSTIDNKLMRKLEANELQLEKTVYELQATQSVNLAEESMGFFTKIFDVLTSIIDPLGLFDVVNTTIDAWSSAAIDAERYLVVSSMSQIGSDVADANASAANVLSNTIGGAAAAISAAESKNTSIMASAVASAGTADTFETMMLKQQSASSEAQAAAAQVSAETQAMTLGAIQDQTRKNSEYQEKASAADEKQAEYEQQKQSAAQAQREQEEADRARDLENHDNIYEIRDAIAGLDLDSMLTPILEENRNQNTNLKTLSSQVTDLIQLVSTMVEYKLATDSKFASTISYDEKARIMNSGYVGGLNNGFQAGFI